MITTSQSAYLSSNATISFIRYCVFVLYLIGWRIFRCDFLYGFILEATVALSMPHGKSNESLSFVHSNVGTSFSPALPWNQHCSSTTKRFWSNRTYQFPVKPNKGNSTIVYTNPRQRSIGLQILSCNRTPRKKQRMAMDH